MRTRVLLLGCLFALANPAQGSTRDLWVWKDANGVTHYSDRPVPGAQKMTITGSTPVPASAAPAASTATKPAGKPAEPASVQYSLLEIWQPESGASFFGADASVNVRMRSEPQLAQGDRLLLYLDGKMVEGSPNAYEYDLTGIERGAHSLSALILDARGNEKIRSAPRVFHIKQQAVDNPRNVGPALKPPPPPAPAPKPNSPK